MKLLTNYIADFLVNFRWYRKKLGGKWYYVRYIHTETGFAGACWEWTQKVNKNNHVVEKEEDFS